MHDQVNNLFKGSWTNAKCFPEIVWVVILQGTKHMTEIYRASWKSLSRHLIVLSIHCLHLIPNPVVTVANSMLICRLHTHQLITGLVRVHPHPHTHQPVNQPDPLDLTSQSLPLSDSLHGLSYVLSLYPDVPLLAVFIHLLFTSQSLVFDLDLGYISLSFRLWFSLDI